MPRIIKKEAEDIEEVMTREWSEGVSDLDIKNLSKSKKKAGKDEIISSAYGLMVKAKEKTTKAKEETNERLSSSLWVAKMVIASVVILIFSASLVYFSPARAQIFQAGFDKIYLYPVQEIKNLAVKYNIIRPQCSSPDKETKIITDKEILSNYIIENQNELQSDQSGKIKSINVNKEDLVGRVAGIEERNEDSKSNFLRLVLNDLKKTTKEISKKQKNLSLELEDRLNRLIKKLKN